jgi:hypothetical protein
LRFYEIAIDGGKTYSARGNPNALLVELDLQTADAAAATAGTVVIWGVAQADLSQATDLANRAITISGGMQPGLPLATAQSKNGGVHAKGYIQKSFGNAVGTDLWLTMVIQNGPPPNAQSPPPKNLILNWPKGTKLGDALQQTLQTGYPGVKPSIKISDQLVAPQDNVGYYGNFKELNAYVRGVSQQIMKGNDTYPGVVICVQKVEVTVHDGTKLRRMRHPGGKA